MAKDPAFLFYYQDFLVGTEFMSDEDTGKYIRILCHLADKSFLTEKQVQSICKASAIPEDIISKLQKNDTGNYFNERLQKEIEKRSKFTESRRKNAASAKHMPKHMENENEIVNKDIKTIKEEFINKHPQSIKIVQHFIKTLESDNRYIPKTDKQKLEWLKVAQWSINQMGEHGYDKVIDIIDYFRNGHADNNNFSWADNWLSLKKLKSQNKDGVTYLDYFWEKAKTKFEYK